MTSEPKLLDTTTFILFPDLKCDPTSVSLRLADAALECEDPAVSVRDMASDLRVLGDETVAIEQGQEARERICVNGRIAVGPALRSHAC